jgi:glycerate kinase
MAQAVGLASVAPERRDVRRATSRGVGELILAALDEPGGRRRLIVGLGGTATNDGGAGLLRALGVRLLDDAGRDIPEAAGAPALATVAALDISGLRLDPERLADVVLASDVDNPLCGSRGASAVFGPQKGASPNDIAVLDAALARWGAVLNRTPPPGRTESAPVADVPARARRAARSPPFCGCSRRRAFSPELTWCSTPPASRGILPGPTLC